MLSYKAARRRLAGLLNEHLMPRFGFKLLRSWPRNFRYRLQGEADGFSLVRVEGFGRSVQLALRPGTSDWMTFDQIFIDEDYDLRRLTRYSELLELYRSIVRSGKRPLIIDLGSNAGFSPVYFSMVWPEALIIAVEPDVDNFRLLERNAAEFPGILPVRAAAASATGTISIVDPGADKNAVRTTASPAPGAVSVPALCMSDIMKEHGSSEFEPFIVKLDIEGAEGELFRANVHWVDDFPLIIAELHDWLYPGEGTSRNFLRTMSECDRDFVYLDENVFSIRNTASGPGQA